MFYNVVSNEYLSLLSFFLFFIFLTGINGIIENRRAEVQVQCSSVNSEEPYLRYVITWVKPCNFLQRVQDRPLNGSSTIYVSLIVGLFPTVGHTKKAVIPTPGLFTERNYAVLFNNLCRKYREPDLHSINKKTRDTHTF